LAVSAALTSLANSGRSTPLRVATEIIEIDPTRRRAEDRGTRHA
jgi:hypothetical protein